MQPLRLPYQKWGLGCYLYSFLNLLDVYSMYNTSKADSFWLFGMLEVLAFLWDLILVTTYGGPYPCR